MKIRVELQHIVKEARCIYGLQKQFILRFVIQY